MRDPQGAWRPLHGDLLYEIEAECIRLHDALAAALFCGNPTIGLVVRWGGRRSPSG